MTVFRTFWKIVAKNKLIIAIYIIIVLVFAAYTSQSNSSSVYTVTKPKMMVQNHDDSALARGLTDYLAQNSEASAYANNQRVDDALFYRDLDYVVDIPQGFGEASLRGQATLDVKKNDGYGARLAERLVNSYTKLISVYRQQTSDQTELVRRIGDTLSHQTEVAMEAPVDATAAQRMAYYYNFMAYAILGGVVYVLCVVWAGFRRRVIQRRMMVSAMPYRRYMVQLLSASALVALFLWLLFAVMGRVLLGSVATSSYGLAMAANSLVFVVCALSITFLIANITTNHDAISGIVNVVALGQAFACGAFIPMSMMPASLVKFAHFLPAYWYIEANNRIIEFSQIDGTVVSHLAANWAMLLLFTVIFATAAWLVGRRRSD